VSHLVDVDPGLPSVRLNDGRTDRWGNLVFGTLNEAPDQTPIGSFYQFSWRHGLRRLALPGVAIPNSICFSLDGRTMWFCDSLDRVIRCCDYDAASAHVHNIRIFARCAGLPDGSIIDGDGCLWNAEWGSGGVRRYTPAGHVDRVVTVPTKNPTCPCLGGPGLHDLYVTSSREEHSDDELDRTPAAGGLFSLRVEDVAGVPDTLFALAGE
jgi:sugar lactone lactonase YvrE